MLEFKNFICFLILPAFALSLTGGYENSNDVMDYEGVIWRLRMMADIDEMKRLLNELKQRSDAKQEMEDRKTKELPLFDARYDPMPSNCRVNITPSNCDEATACLKRSGIYQIQIDSSSEPFYVQCDAKTSDGGWTIIQRRFDGSEDFYRDWSEYKKGFGSLQGEFFIGLDKLYDLTNFMGQQELMVLLEDEGVSTYARYSSFKIGNESDHYILKSIGKYSGTAGDSLLHHVGMKFTTKDRDNDNYNTNCAQEFMGAWWHNKCHKINLNGKYGDHTFGKGLNWFDFKGHTRSIQYVQMMIRRRRE